MNVEIRAKRVLSQLQNYQSAEDISAADKPAQSIYGNLIGRYRNSETDIDALWFFERAVIWEGCDAVTDIPYDEITRIELPFNKNSEWLIIFMQDGIKISLPVRGKRGNFFDSMEVLRFFDRVLANSRK